MSIAYCGGGGGEAEGCKKEAGSFLHTEKPKLEKSQVGSSNISKCGRRVYYSKKIEVEGLIRAT